MIHSYMTCLVRAEPIDGARLPEPAENEKFG